MKFRFSSQVWNLSSYSCSGSSTLVTRQPNNRANINQADHLDLLSLDAGAALHLNVVLVSALELIDPGTEKSFRIGLSRCKKP